MLLLPRQMQVRVMRGACWQLRWRLCRASLTCVAEAQIAPAWLNQEVTRATPQVIANYKQIHQYPELGKQEVKTAAFVRSELTKMGFSEFVPEATLETAVIAVLDSGKPGAVVVLRSELDARPGTESADVDYKSKIPGRMHNCGHDAHTAILLSVADILMRHKADLIGKYVFLFQPAEETQGGSRLKIWS